MSGVEVVAVIAAGGIIAAIARRGRPGRKPRTRATRSARSKSWLVTMYNSTGAKPVASGDASGAAAELTGRAVGATARRGGRRWRAVRTAASNGRTRLAGRAAPRWQQRQANRRPGLIDQWRARRAAKADATAAPTAPPPAPAPSPAPRPTAPSRTTGGPVTTPDPAATGTLTAGLAPPLDWAVSVDRVAGFQPEDDAALVAFMAGETAGMLAYAEAMVQARENCVNDVGLDPSAVEGLTTYSDHVSEAADRMAEAHRQFLAVYGEVLALAANGVVMPHNGRWFTGASA